MSAEILIVDDEPDICELVSGILQDEGYTTRTAREADEAINAIKARRPNLLFLDIWLQGSKLDGLQILDAAKEQYPDLPMTSSRNRSRPTGWCWWPNARWRIPGSSARSRS
jgi:two-component system nitrogen regulation response regulator NtrX